MIEFLFTESSVAVVAAVGGCCGFFSCFVFFPCCWLLCDSTVRKKVTVTALGTFLVPEVLPPSFLYMGCLGLFFFFLGFFLRSWNWSAVIGCAVLAVSVTKFCDWPKFWSWVP